MIPRSKLIPLRKEFDRIRKTGHWLDSPSFKILVAPNSLGFNRYAVIVSKKVSLKAVERHRIKRRICDAIMEVKDKASNKLDVVVMTKKEAVNKSIEELKKETSCYYI